MQNLKGLKWACLLTVISGMANADLVLDNKVVITDINGISVSPSSGDVFITTSSKNYSVTSGGTTPPPANSVTIRGFAASPSSITVGQSTSISWSTLNATSCTATGGTGGWAGSAISPLSSGAKSIAISASGSYTFGLTCNGTNGPVKGTALVTVTSGTTPPPVPSSCKTPRLKGSVVLWKDVWKIDFPGPSYDNERVSIPRTGYTALKFNTGNVVDHGGITSVANTFTNGRRLGAISECPGDFDVSKACTKIWGSGGGIGWATDGFKPTGTYAYCQLKANTTYYMNFTFTDGFDPASTTCLLGENCIASLQHINLK